jgi:hypothetical protein
MVQTIRSITGKPDPDKHLSPQERQQAMLQQMKELQRQEAMKDAQLAVVQGNAKKLLAQAEEASAKAHALLNEAGSPDGADTGDAQAQAADLAYREKLYRIQKRADDAVFELRKQLMTAEARAELHAQGDDAKREVAEKQSSTVIMKTLLDNESRERIAAINDRTLEATKGIAAQIDGLDEDLKALERVKADKPTPQDEARQMIADHNDQLAAKAKQAATDGRIDDTHARIDDLAGAVKGVGAQAKAASKAATARPSASGAKAAPAVPDLSGILAALETMMQKVDRLSGGAPAPAAPAAPPDDEFEQHVNFNTDPDGRIQGAVVKRVRKAKPKESTPA